ncbi:hypothetical protein [Pseudomonas coronafaciens]|uniref:hypothetical protein n=1 Tax=Pseudomonas coronafaciens TaxID=53409 RepID=UPI0011C3D824|nr:hypothetical protein [Pseudomonas coronafaciens]
MLTTDKGSNPAWDTIFIEALQAFLLLILKPYGVASYVHGRWKAFGGPPLLDVSTKLGAMIDSLPKAGLFYRL